MIPGSANPLLLASAAEAGAYQIERSLRFNSSDSAYLSKNFGSAGNRKKWTYSLWVKRSALGVEQHIFSAGVAATADDGLNFDSSDRLSGYTFRGSLTSSLVTTQVFRDCSAWYHILWAWDADNATAAQRSRLYVNGVEVTAFSTSSYPASGTSSDINNNVEHSIGDNRPNFTNGNFSGCLADCFLIDGQALDPTSFTEVDATTGQLVPIEYTGTFGTNGFHLPFSDNSTAAALGTDTSGNSNTWTVNNLSVASGAGNDSLIDTPTNYEAASGNNAGNYATFNAVDKGSNITLSNGNLDVSKSSTTWANSAVRGTIGVSSGKWYWEITKTNAASYSMYGVAVSAASFSENYGAPNNETWTYVSNLGNKFGDSDGGSGASYGATFTNGDVIGIALDMDAGTLVFYKNGSSQGTAYSTLSGKTIFPWIDLYDGSDTASVNFGQRPFAYTAPSGFKALCTTNLPDPQTITTSGSYTGNGVADGPFVYLNGVPTAMTVNGNAVTFGTEADKLSNGFKIRTTSTTYNQNASTYNYSITSTGDPFKIARAQANP